MQTTRRAIALFLSAALLASLTAATVAAPASAAKPKCLGKEATIVGTNKGEPTPTSAADFAEWGIKVHTVTTVSRFDADHVVLGEVVELEAGDPFFAWYRHSQAWHDRYYEGIDEAPQAYSGVEDQEGSGLSTVFINISSPSKGTSVARNVPGAGDDRLIDVGIYP